MLNHLLCTNDSDKEGAHKSNISVYHSASQHHFCWNKQRAYGLQYTKLPDALGATNQFIEMLLPLIRSRCGLPRKALLFIKRMEDLILSLKLVQMHGPELKKHSHCQCGTTVQPPASEGCYIKLADMPSSFQAPALLTVSTSLVPRFFWCFGPKQDAPF